MVPKNREEEQYTSLSIPTSLYKKIEERVKITEFESVSDYVIFVLREVLRDIEEDEEEKQGLTKKKKEQAFSKEDEEQVKERLRKLGYLD